LECCEEREPITPRLDDFIKHTPMSKYGICPHLMASEEVCRNTIKIISISIVVGILRIRRITGGGTVWALPGDQRIQHVFNARRGSIDGLYPHMGMDVIWLADSPNRL
jgi:hypothetical protein